MIKKTSATLEQALEYYKQGFSAIPLLPKNYTRSCKLGTQSANSGK